MIFNELSVLGAFEVKIEAIHDSRGVFGRVFCENEFSELGLNAQWAQANISLSKQAGTLRGMHFQSAPFSEVKYVRAVRGLVADVVLDLRKNSPSFGRHAIIELDCTARNAVYIPKGCAHGFQTLCDDCELLYLHSDAHNPEAEAGIQALDTRLGINWPLPVSNRSQRDEALPMFNEVIKL